MATPTISSAAQKELDNISKIFHVSDHDLVQLTNAFGQAYRHGLQVPDQPIVMGPSFVTHLANGTEQGTFLTLDISWNSIHVSKISLDGKKSFTSTSKVFDISKETMKADANVFFAFLAECISVFLKENAIQQHLALGFTFAFALQKTSLDHGKLLGWSKGFSINGVVGKDVVELLQNALDKAKVGVKCVAIINDTVGALLSESYLCTPCVISAIYGAGTNGSYAEAGSAIAKLPQFQGSSMMINTEWGAFKDRALLKPNVFDDKLDEGASNKGTYIFQKMSCWFYLGEITRLVLLSLVQSSPPLLFGGVVTDLLKKHRGFPSFNMFQVEDAKNINAIKEIIAEVLGYAQSTISDEDAEIVRRVCTTVAIRGGKLAGVPVAALLAHLGYVTPGQAIAGGTDRIPIAADGELFMGSAQFESRLKQSVAAIVGKGIDQRLDFHRVQHGGIVGAAIAAYDATKD